MKENEIFENYFRKIYLQNEILIPEKERERNIGNFDF